MEWDMFASLPSTAIFYPLSNQLLLANGLLAKAWASRRTLCCVKLTATFQDRCNVWRTKPLMVIYLHLAALRIRTASSSEQRRSMVVLCPLGRIGVLARVRFNATAPGDLGKNRSSNATALI